MKVVAFDLRAAGPRSYSHAIIDMGAVVLEDGEVVDEFYAFAGENKWLDIRPSILEDFRVAWKDVKAAGSYHGNVGDLCAFIDHARGNSPAWAFDAKDKGAYILASLKYAKNDLAFDRIADVCALQAVMSAIGASPPIYANQDGITHRLELGRIEPTTNALERAKIAAMAVTMLEDETRRHYFPTERQSKGQLLPVAPPLNFDPFDDPASPTVLEDRPKP